MRKEMDIGKFLTEWLLPILKGEINNEEMDVNSFGKFDGNVLPGGACCC
jgi:hypothetical protein